ncbi:MAG: alpha-hydroxy acid oxidase [Candidatus Puniceispirillaceae bacterium]
MSHYMTKFPRISDLEKQAQKRLPPFVGAYLFSGTGQNAARDATMTDYQTVKLLPRFMRGRVPTNLALNFLDTTFSAPFSVAPIGLSSLIWPGSEAALAKAAQKSGYGYALSTVAGASVEQIGPLAGDKGFFQLYAANNRELAWDLMARAKKAGFTKLILTADVPGPSRREEMRIAGAPIGSRSESSPTLRVLWQAAMHPQWAMAALAQGGKFRFRNMEPYASKEALSNITKFIGSELNGSLTWDYLSDLRDMWDGPMLLKGPLHYEDCRRALDAGLDGLVLSNHGGRQLDCAPSPISQLPGLRKKLGPQVTLAIDSGLRSGLDIARAIALGADFCFLGRAFLMGVAALGVKGAHHTGDVLLEELSNTMVQLGVETIEELAEVDSQHLF